MLCSPGGLLVKGGDLHCVFVDTGIGSVTIEDVIEDVFSLPRPASCWRVWILVVAVGQHLHVVWHLWFKYHNDLQPQSWQAE